MTVKKLYFHFLIKVKNTVLFLLRNKKKDTISKRNWLGYLGYAVGEIILVVAGILIAVELDNRNEQSKALKVEIESYKDIVADLKEDSVQFATLIRQCRKQLEYYYHIYGEIKGEKEYDPAVYYDVLGVSREVAPRTEQNHQSTIEKLNNKEVRNLLNDYFFRQRIMMKAVAELNTMVEVEARPFIFKNGIVDPELSFHDNVYGFLPKDNLIINYKILKSFYDNPELANLLSVLRISMGHMLSELNKIAKLNVKLIENIQSEIKKNSVV